MEHESLKDILQNSKPDSNQSQNSNKNSIQVEPVKKKNKMRGPPKGSKRRPNLAVGIKSGLWKINEMKAYLKFITRFESHFKDKATRKKKKIFHRMSNFIRSRTAQQCRSHHQKLEIKYENHKIIIQFIQNQIAKISQVIQRGAKYNSLEFEDQNHVQIKLQQDQIEKDQKGTQKLVDNKTSLEEQNFYEVTIARGCLIINIQEDQMQVWNE